MSLRGNDRVYIDDVGGGTKTGASKTKTANWRQPISGTAEQPSVPDRVKNTVSGGAKRSLASDINSMASIYDLTQGGRTNMMSDYLSDYEHGLNRAKDDLRQLEDLGVSEMEIKRQENIVDDWQRKVDAIQKAIDSQPGAVQANYGLADSVKSSADEDIDYARQGLNGFWQLAVDTGAKLTQMGIDAAKSWYLLNQFNVNSDAEDFVKRLPLTGRIYGENTQTARKESADAKSAAVYGATSAIADTEIEKLFDGLSKFYGKARTEELARNFAKMFEKNKTIQKLAKAGFDDLGEGIAESFITDLADQLLKSIYNGKNPIQNGIETEWDRVGRNMLINTIIGILSGDSN